MPSASLLFDTEVSSSQYQIRQGDCLDLLKQYNGVKFDLIITSPPYNIGKTYETKTTIEEYLSGQEEIIEELIKKLSPQGSLCWQVGNYVEHGEVFPLDVYYYHIFKKLGLKLRNRIMWYFGHGLHASNRFSGRYETILWFTKGDDYIFNLDDVRVPSKYPGKKHFKGPNKGKLSGNPLGKNPTDVWEVLANDWERGFWNIPNVKSNHPEKTEHPCQFPVELVERCVLALTNANSWVLDPFMGVGSSLIAAIKNGRNAIGFERDKTYCDIADERIDALRSGTLKTRPLTQPVYEPPEKPRGINRNNSAQIELTGSHS